METLRDSHDWRSSPTVILVLTVLKRHLECSAYSPQSVIPFCSLPIEKIFRLLCFFPTTHHTHLFSSSSTALLDAELLSKKASHSSFLPPKYSPPGNSLASHFCIMLLFLLPIGSSSWVQGQRSATRIFSAYTKRSLCASVSIRSYMMPSSICREFRTASTQ